MPTLTIRNVPPRLVKMLKALARRNGRSMEQEVRDLLEESLGERQSVIQQIERGWRDQARRPEPGEIDAWIQTGQS